MNQLSKNWRNKPSHERYPARTAIGRASFHPMNGGRMPVCHSQHHYLNHPCMRSMHQTVIKNDVENFWRHLTHWRHTPHHLLSPGLLAFSVTTVQPFLHLANSLARADMVALILQECAQCYDEAVNETVGNGYTEYLWHAILNEGYNLEVPSPWDGPDSPHTLLYAIAPLPYPLSLSA